MGACPRFGDSAMSRDDIEYYARRAEQAARMAANAADPKAARVHADLARIYRERAGRGDGASADAPARAAGG